MLIRTKKTSVFFCILILILISFCGCKIESAAEHDAKTSTASRQEETTDESTSSPGQGTAAEGESTQSTTKASGAATPKQSNGNKDETEKTAPSTPQTDAPATPNQTSPPAETTKKQTVDVSVSIDCSSAVGFAGISDGTILKSTQISLPLGSTVFDAVKGVCDKNGVDIFYSESQMGKYIYKIGTLAEKDCGGSSGWVYTISGKRVMKSVDKQVLKDGDSVEFSYYIA